MIGLIDYGAGNMKSVANALSYLEAPYKVCLSPSDLADTDRIILPGVGHFAPAARRLNESGIADTLKQRADKETPLLGICLGLQLLLSTSDEAPGSQGLNIIAGKTVTLKSKCVPHMGWNKATSLGEDKLLPVRSDNYFYFAHSFVAADIRTRNVLATTQVENLIFPSAIRDKNVWGVQFHPEKSGEAGLDIIRRFAKC